MSGLLYFCENSLGEIFSAALMNLWIVQQRGVHVYGSNTNMKDRVD